MIRKPLCFVLFATTCACFCIGTAGAWQNDSKTIPEGVFQDQWYAVLIDGRRIGVSHEIRRRIGKRIESRETTRMKRNSAGTISVNDTNIVYIETLDGKPLGFIIEDTDGGATVTTSGSIADGMLNLVVKQRDKTTTRRIKWDPKSRMSWGAFLQERKQKKIVGTRYTIFFYDPEASVEAPVESHYEVVGRETVETLDGKVEALRLKSEMIISGETLRSDDWLDEKGVLVRTRLDLAGMQFEVVRCSEAQAGEKLDPPDLFITFSVPIERPIDSESARKLVLRLEVPKDLQLRLPRTEMQKARRVSDGVYELTVERIDASGLAKAVATRNTQEGRKCLQATIFANAADPAIKRMAKKALAGAKRPSDYETVHLLREYVSESVDGEFDIGFATASDVAKERKGDCTEFAVLLTAMARASSIPARCATGLVYAPNDDGEGGAFWFHMWTQVLLDGRWIDVDAAMERTNVNPVYITLGTTDLEDGFTSAALGIQLIQLMGALRITVVSVQ